MDTTEKFSTKLNKEVLKKLRSFAKASNKNIAVIVSEALAAYFEQVEVRPAFRQATKEVVSEHRELLKELAK